MERKYDWNKIRELKRQMTWAEIAEEIGADVSSTSLAKQFSQHNIRSRAVRSDGSSLAAFAKARRLDAKRATCVICTELDDDTRQQLADASGQGITRKEQIAWLDEVFGVRVTTHELSAHFSGRHDGG